MIRNVERIPAHLPKRLTISFPIWGLYDTEAGGAYRDLDKMMREHKARGFNCIRLDDGAGIIHDLNGNLRGPITFGHIFGEHDGAIRQFGANGAPGLCDPHKRLIELFEAAKRHGVYIILSSWYYLHTCWLVKDRAINDELHALAPLERFSAFAKFLHYILCELEARDLADMVAFAEIFNEADGLYFVNGYNQNNLTEEEFAVFRAKHEEAISWLKERHPNILFAFDSYTYYTDFRQVPKNLEVFNFHNYFLWFAMYTMLEANESFLKEEKVSKEELRKLADCDYPPTDDWYHRVWYYINLDPEKIPQAEKLMIDFLKEHVEEFRAKLKGTIAHLKHNLENGLSNTLVVCGEGVTYSGGYRLIWEEKSEEYWMLVKEMMQGYRELGLWGTVVRTCSGPEDPVWNLCPEKLLEMNRIFLGE